jgi:hypothetical protein
MGNRCLRLRRIPLRLNPPTFLLVYEEATLHGRMKRPDSSRLHAPVQPLDPTRQPPKEEAKNPRSFRRWLAAARASVATRRA